MRSSRCLGRGNEAIPANRRDDPSNRENRGYTRRFHFSSVRGGCSPIPAREQMARVPASRVSDKSASFERRNARSNPFAMILSPRALVESCRQLISVMRIECFAGTLGRGVLLKCFARIIDAHGIRSSSRSNMSIQLHRAQCRSHPRKSRNSNVRDPSAIVDSLQSLKSR